MATPAADPKLGEALAALACALDLGEGLRAGHAARTALLGTRIADELGLPTRERIAVLDASLLQDAGGPATAAGISALFRTDDRIAKRALRELDLARRGQVRRGSLRLSVRGFASGLGRTGDALPALVGLKDERGAELARLLELPAAADAVGALGERWDGKGPRGLAGTEIPVAARI